MPYTFRSRVRYSECGEDGLQSLFSIMNYMQDCSTFQSEALGLGTKRMQELHRAWLLSAWHVAADRYPAFGEEIEVGTFACGFQSFYGFRRFFIRDAKGAFCVRADSIWFLYDTEHEMPVKSDEALMLPYLNAEQGTDFDMLHLGKMSRKLPAPRNGVPGEPFAVPRHFLDSNLHMNNARYLDLACEAAEVFRPKEWRASYVHAAKLGDVLIPCVEKREHERIVGLNKEDGSLSAVVSFVV